MTLRFTRLDRPAIRKLQPGEAISEHGITAERLADGDLRYTVNVMVDGQRIHRVIGKESDGVTRTQAEEFIEQARSDARASRLSLPKGRKTHLSFAQAADAYIKRLDEAGGKNMVAKRRHVTRYLKPYFGNQQLNGITTFTVEKYKRQRLKDDASGGTVNRELATLSHLVNKALEWKWLDRKPFKVGKEHEAQGRVIALTDEQCDVLMQAAIGSADPDLWLFIAFGLNTAMRHSEILATRWEQLDLDNLRLFIPKAKSGEREQPVTPELVEILRKEREMRDDRIGWVFPALHKDSGTGHRGKMSEPFRRAVEKAGLDPSLVTPHTMRHTAITNLVQAGVDLPTVQRISGHKTLAMVLRYSHVHGQHIDRAIRAIGRTIPQPSPNETGDAITQELHRRHRRGPKLVSG